MKKLLMNTALAGSLLLTGVSGAYATKPQTIDDRIAEIEAEYAQQLESLRAEGDRIAAEAPNYNGLETAINISFDVTWETTMIVLDLPEVTMKTRELSLHLPQFRMNTKRIVWDNPEMTMVLKVIGKYPCFRGLKQYMCDIKTKVPEWKMVRREAKVSIPELFWDRTSFKMDIPEFKMKRVEIKLHLPQFRAEEVNVSIDAYKARAEALAAKAEALGRAQADEIGAAVASDLTANRARIAAQFDTAIEAVARAVAEIRARGADPATVRAEAGVVNLVAQLDDLKIRRAETLRVIDDKLAELAS